MRKMLSVSRGSFRWWRRALLLMIPFGSCACDHHPVYAHSPTYRIALEGAYRAFYHTSGTPIAFEKVTISELDRVIQLVKPIWRVNTRTQYVSGETQVSGYSLLIRAFLWRLAKTTSPDEKARIASAGLEVAVTHLADPESGWTVYGDILAFRRSLDSVSAIPSSEIAVLCHDRWISGPGVVLKSPSGDLHIRRELVKQLSGKTAPTMQGYTDPATGQQYVSLAALPRSLIYVSAEYVQGKVVELTVPGIADKERRK